MNPVLMHQLSIPLIQEKNDFNFQKDGWINY